mgnify:CR=1 FL=1
MVRGEQPMTKSKHWATKDEGKVVAKKGGVELVSECANNSLDSGIGNTRIGDSGQPGKE